MSNAMWFTLPLLQNKKRLVNVLNQIHKRRESVFLVFFFFLAACMCGSQIKLECFQSAWGGVGMLK